MIELLPVKKKYPSLSPAAAATHATDEPTKALHNPYVTTTASQALIHSPLTS